MTRPSRHEAGRPVHPGRPSRKDQEASASDPSPLSIHPHYPFVFIDRILKRETSPLVVLWVLRRDFRSQLLPRWCALAETRYWAWDQCRELREYLTSLNEPIPKPLRQLATRPRPRHRGAPEKFGERFLAGRDGPHPRTERQRSHRRGARDRPGARKKTLARVRRRIHGENGQKSARACARRCRKPAGRSRTPSCPAQREYPSIRPRSSDSISRFIVLPPAPAWD